MSLQYEWLRQLGADAENTVVGLARDIQPVQAKLADDSISNVHLFQADMTDHKALTAAATETAKFLDSVDYLIVNGAYQSKDYSGMKPTDYIGKEDILRKDMTTSLEVNVIGVIYSINAFLPLVQKSGIKKIVVISTGMADPEIALQCGFETLVTYSAIKAALNMVVVKYAVELKSAGITLLALSPGVVNTRETPRRYL